MEIKKRTYLMSGSGVNYDIGGGNQEKSEQQTAVILES